MPDILCTVITREMAQFRALVIQSVRSFFESHGYLEVDTPALSQSLIPEPHIEVFETEHRLPYASAGAERNRYYLVPSPELWMKDLLTDGYGDIYQISHCFRNAESTSPIHSPEFTMLEWYTVNADYRDSAVLTEHLLAALHDELAHHPLARNVESCRPPARLMSVEHAAEEIAGIPVGTLQDPEKLAAAANEAGMLVPAPAAARDSEELFQRLFLTLVEVELPCDVPVILTDYPAYVPTLAKAGTDGFAERWELYLGGLEIANCYTEEREPSRIEAYLRTAGAAKRFSLVPHPTFETLHRFSNAPPCSGVALGIDRLIMALTGCQDIRGVIF